MTNRAFLDAISRDYDGLMADPFARPARRASVLPPDVMRLGPAASAAACARRVEIARRTYQPLPPPALDNTDPTATPRYIALSAWWDAVASEANCPWGDAVRACGLVLHVEEKGARRRWAEQRREWLRERGLDGEMKG